jgi:hypothetical protein
MVETHFSDGKQRFKGVLKQFLQARGAWRTLSCALVYLFSATGLPHAVCFPGIHSIVTAANAPPVTAVPCHR